MLQVLDVAIATAVEALDVALVKQASTAVEAPLHPASMEVGSICPLKV